MNFNQYASHPGRSPHNMTLWISIVALMLMSGLFLGLLATTANFVMIGIGLGLVFGAFLLAAPRLVIWLVIALSLSTGALVSIAGPEYVKLPWAIALLSFLLWPMALLNMLQQKHIPSFIWMSVIFVMLCIAGTGIEWYSVSEFAAGFKRYFQAYGLLFALAALPLAWNDVRRWQKLVLIVALLQLPFALYEFIVLVPLRGGLAAGSQALDVVAGTFGANLNGGSANAEMAAFLLIVMAFLTVRWRAGQLGTMRFFLCALICLIPLGLGETKIVVLLLPMVAFILLRKDFFRSPLRYLPVILVFAAITALLAYIYVTVMMKSTFAYVLNDTLRYNLEHVGYGDAFLNRSTVISFWWDRHGWYDPVSFLFGHGMGSSFWAPNNPNAGHVGMHFPRYSIDLTTVSTLLWDTGLIGLGMYFSIIAAAWIAANRLWRRSQDVRVRADALAIQAAIAVFVVFMFYSSSTVNLLPFQVLIAAVLGYLGFLCRTDAAATAGPDRKPRSSHSYYTA